MKKIILSLVLYTPSLVFAQAIASGRTIKGIAHKITTFLSTAVMPMLFTIALTWFIWGVVDFIKNAENSEERKKGKQRMLWGIIALFVMVTFLGLTTVLTTSVFGNDPFLPQLYTAGKN